MYIKCHMKQEKLFNFQIFAYICLAKYVYLMKFDEIMVNICIVSMHNMCIAHVIKLWQ